MLARQLNLPTSHCEYLRTIPGELYSSIFEAPVEARVENALGYADGV